MTEPQEQSGAQRSFPTVGRWRVTALPGGWMYVANFGIKQMVWDPQAIPANVTLGEDALATADSLTGYISTQTKLMKHHLIQPAMAGPQPMPFAGAEEAHLMFIRHVPLVAGREPCTMLHAQRYVRLGTWVGIVTLTVVESQLSVVRPAYEQFLKGLRIMPPSAASQPGEM